MNQEIKADEGKLQISLVPTEIVRNIAAIRMYGINKYGSRENWRQVEPQRYIDALSRHILLFNDDPTGLDEESGYPHLWHIACNVAFLCELMKGEWVKNNNCIFYEEHEGWCQNKDIDMYRDYPSEHYCEGCCHRQERRNNDKTGNEQNQKTKADY